MKKDLFKSVVVWIIIITGIIVFSIFTYIIGDNKGQLFWYFFGL